MISRFSLNTAKVLVLLLVVFCLLSCSVTDNHVVKYDSFPNQYLLTADSVPTQALYDNVFMTIVNGTVVVSSSKADTLMHFYSTPALDYLFGTGVRGHSSHEMQSLPTFCQSTNGDLYVRGFTPYSLRRFRISQDRLLERVVTISIFMRVQMTCTLSMIPYSIIMTWRIWKWIHII